MANVEIKLEKNAEAVLDTNEQKFIKTLSAETLQKSLNEIKNTKFDLSNTIKGVTLDTIVKNYNTATKQIEINGEKIPVKWGSDLAAWMQILMIADKRSVWSTKKTTLGIDGKIGNKTSASIDDYKDGATTPINTTPNQPKNNINIKTLTIDEWLKQTILLNIGRVDLAAFGGKLKQQFDWAVKSGILDTNYKIRGMRIEAKAKQFVVKIVESKTGIQNKEYKIGLESILENKSGEVDHDKFANQMYAMIGLIYNDIMANNKKYAIEKEKKGLETLTNEWNNLQREATNKINKAKTWEEKIKLTDQYSGKYAALAKKVATGKVNYIKTEQTKLAAHINQQKVNLDKTNILTNCPQHVNERYATFKKNVGTGAIMVMSALNNYITEAENIIKLQQAYEKRGMVKVPQLTQTIRAMRERLVNQKLYLTSKTALENDYNAFYKKLTSKDPLQRGQAKAERKQKVERLNNGTYRNSNQPTYKEIFTRVGKTAEYTDYVKKYNILMAS